MGLGKGFADGHEIPQRQNQPAVVQIQATMVRGRSKIGCLGVMAMDTRLVTPLIKIKNTGEV